MKKTVYLFLFIFILFTGSYSLWAVNLDQDGSEECTIGVASGKATQDGRPMIWKTRDTSARNNEIYYNTSSSNKFNFVAVMTANASQSSTPWMGVNEKGFAILNSDSDDLATGDSGPGNGTTMYIALANFATVAEFEHWLDSTNVTGRSTKANYAVMDSTGTAAIFETSGYQFWKFDANDSTVAPNGYVLRTNFAFNGDAKNGLNDGIYSIERYRRTTKLIGDFYAGDTLNHKSILRTQMRDFSDFDSDQVPVPYPRKWLSYRPYGYIYCSVSICRSTSVSAAVIHGVLPEESARLSTLWAILGQPASGIAVPYWPVTKPPTVANGDPTASLCDVAQQIRSLLFDYPENTAYIDSYKLLDGTGGGLWTKTFPAEDSILTAAETKLNQWRNGLLSIQDMVETEYSLANYAYYTLLDAYNSMLTPIATNDGEDDNLPGNFSLSQNYPNPFNAETTIQFTLPQPCFVRLKIFNSLGETVETAFSQTFNAGSHFAKLNLANLASGIYFYQLSARSETVDGKTEFIDVKKLILVK